MTNKLLINESLFVAYYLWVCEWELRRNEGGGWCTIATLESKVKLTSLLLKSLN